MLVRAEKTGIELFSPNSQNYNPERKVNKYYSARIKTTLSFLLLGINVKRADLYMKT